MKRKLLSVMCLFAALGVSSAAQAQGPEAGEATYIQYCATCHGADGMGEGPMTQIMTEKVSDLTMLSAQNDGVFPMLHVIHVIDGRTGLRGHGGSMPVYGALFDEEGSTSGPFGNILYARGKILSLAYYLESIQVK